MNWGIEMSALDVLLDKDSWFLEIDTDWESGIKEYTWNWDNDEHPPLEEGRKELLDLRTRIAELEALTQWQPIETAKNGDLVVLFGGVSYVTVGIVNKSVKKVMSLWTPIPKPPEEE